MPALAQCPPDRRVQPRLVEIAPLAPSPGELGLGEATLPDGTSPQAAKFERGIARAERLVGYILALPRDQYQRLRGNDLPIAAPERLPYADLARREALRTVDGIAVAAADILPGEAGDQRGRFGHAVFGKDRGFVLVEITVIDAFALGTEGRIGAVHDGGDDGERVPFRLGPGTACSRRSDSAGCNHGCQCRPD